MNAGTPPAPVGIAGNRPGRDMTIHPYSNGRGAVMSTPTIDTATTSAPPELRTDTEKALWDALNNNPGSTRCRTGKNRRNRRIDRAKNTGTLGRRPPRPSRTEARPPQCRHLVRHIKPSRLRHTHRPARTHHRDRGAGKRGRNPHRASRCRNRRCRIETRGLRADRRRQRGSQAGQATAGWAAWTGRGLSA